MQNLKTFCTFIANGQTFYRMVQEIKKAFRAKYNKINLSNERLEAYANKWANKIEDENAIESFLDALDIEPLEDIAKLDDALRKPKPTEEPKPKDDESTPQPNNEIEALKQQISALSEAVANKNKSDLAFTRSEQLKNIPEELRVALKYTPLDSLTDDQFNELKVDLSKQADALELKKSTTNPKFGGAKVEGKLTTDEKEYLESRKQKKS